MAAESEWEPNPQRTISTEATSRGLQFSVTISFQAPSEGSVFLDEGDNGGIGEAWFIPRSEGGYDLFKVMDFQGDPHPELPPAEPGTRWLWEEDEYEPNQVITLTYLVEVDPAVPYAAYSVGGFVGKADPPLFPIQGDDTIEVRAPDLLPRIDQPFYIQGEEVQVTVEAAYGDGSPASEADVWARFNRTGDEMQLEEDPANQGEYEGVYVLPEDAAIGPWRIDVTFDDDHQNTADVSLTFEVVF